MPGHRRNTAAGGEKHPTKDRQDHHPALWISDKVKEDEKKRSEYKGVRHSSQKLDEILEEKILNVILDPKSFDSLAHKIHEYKIKLGTRAISEIPNLKKRLAGIDAKIEKIIDAIGGGTINPHPAKEKLSKLETHRDYVQSEIDRLKQKHLVGFRIDDRIGQIIRDHVYHLLKNATPKEKGQFFRKFMGKIVLNQDSPSIYYSLLNLNANTLKGSESIGVMASPIPRCGICDTL